MADRGAAQEERVRRLARRLRSARGLLDNFWDHLYPDRRWRSEFRAAPLEWIGSKLDIAVKSSSALPRRPRISTSTKNRGLSATKTGQERSKGGAREGAKEGKLTPEIFDKRSARRPRFSTSEMEKNLRRAAWRNCRHSTNSAGRSSEGPRPRFRTLREPSTEVRHTVHTLASEEAGNRAGSGGGGPAAYRGSARRQPKLRRDAKVLRAPPRLRAGAA